MPTASGVRRELPSTYANLRVCAFRGHLETNRAGNTRVPEEHRTVLQQQRINLGFLRPKSCGKIGGGARPRHQPGF